MFLKKILDKISNKFVRNSFLRNVFDYVYVMNAKKKFSRDFADKSSSLTDGRFECRWEDRWPCLNDATSTTGFDAHYLYHCAWAGRAIAKDFQSPERKWEKHVDMSSSLNFITMLSAFVPVEFYDYRPALLNLSNLECMRGDLSSLSFADNSVHSLSCMHVIEHIGLERYGDPFDPQGDVKAMRELERVLAPGGHLYFVVPVGKEARIQYNAHRIYTYRQILTCFKDLRLCAFAYVDDTGKFFESASEEHTRGSFYGCGCFEFVNM